MVLLPFREFVWLLNWIPSPMPNSSRAAGSLHNSVIISWTCSSTANRSSASSSCSQLIGLRQSRRPNPSNSCKDKNKCPPPPSPSCCQMKIAVDGPVELERNLELIFHHNRIAIDHLAMTNDTITRTSAAQQPIDRPKTKCDGPDIQYWE